MSNELTLVDRDQMPVANPDLPIDHGQLCSGVAASEQQRRERIGHGASIMNRAQVECDDVGAHADLEDPDILTAQDARPFPGRHIEDVDGVEPVGCGLHVLGAIRSVQEESKPHLLNHGAAVVACGSVHTDADRQAAPSHRYDPGDWVSEAYD